MTKRTPFRTITVPDGVDTSRLDVLVAACVSGISRRMAKNMLRDGSITVNGRRAKGGEPPRAGTVVEIWAAPPPCGWTPLEDKSISLEVYYADADLLVVAKPSGVPSVPLRPDEAGTLAGAVAFRFPECAALYRKAGDGGLLQRLDRETSGAVMVARNPETFDALIGAQHAGDIEKRYLALVRSQGALPGLVETPLAPIGRRGATMRPSPDGRKTCTLIKVLKEGGGLKLVEARIHRGVRHQIRAHLASVGAPIVGDHVYGEGPYPKGCGRLFLHAARVTFVQPRTGEKLSIGVPLPKELSKFVEKNLIISF
jgi:23S rRNA pseudouridine1911/1915/1917 synthase